MGKRLAFRLEGYCRTSVHLHLRLSSFSVCMVIDMAPREDWHLDKRVPIGIIIAILSQTLFFTYIGTQWKTVTDNRINSLEKYQAATENQKDRILVLEQSIMRVREDLAEIKDLLRSQKTGQLTAPVE